MKKILVITNIYPMLDPTYVGTNVVHYFTKEWVKMGYDVKVVHIKSYFPHIFYVLGKPFQNIIKAKSGSVVHTKRVTKPDKYMIDNVPVLMSPVFKLFPHLKFNNKIIRKVTEFIVMDNKDDNFLPDIVVGHFRNPQLQILYYLKDYYHNIKTCLVMHSAGDRFKTTYPGKYNEYLESLDLLGFRSQSFRNGFEKMFDIKKNSFLCYSGIPHNYLKFRKRLFNGEVDKYCFVGSLFKVKRVENTIIALSKAYPKKNFTFEIVGDGAEMTKLKKLTKELNLDDNIFFHGKLSRDKAQEIMYKSDIYVMVSYSEAFGLSYVEALGKGCITIGTKDQGIDGVIINRKNGFLCQADNINELSDIMIQIQTLDKNVLQEMSLNAFRTASQMTEYEVAKNYIEAII